MIVAPSFGGIYGGVEITLTGEAFGAVEGSVTLEGRACEVVSWSNSQVVFLAPPRVTNGRRVCTEAVAPIVVTKDGGGTLSGAYTYRVSILTKVLNLIRERIALIDPQTDPVYNYKVTAQQIINFHRDVGEEAGAPFPHVMVYAADTDYSQGQNTPCGFYTGKTPCVATATMTLSEPCNWDEETRAMGADLCRAIQKVAKADPYGLAITIDRVSPGQETVPEYGSLGSVVVEFTVEWKHIDVNMNSITEGE